MKEITYFKMPFKNNLFNKNQRVFVICFTGSNACKVAGKYRGKNRYIKGWVHYRARNINLPEFKKIMVEDDFYIKLMSI